MSGSGKTTFDIETHTLTDERGYTAIHTRSSDSPTVTVNDSKGATVCVTSQPEKQLLFLGLEANALDQADQPDPARRQAINASTAALVAALQNPNATSSDINRLLVATDKSVSQTRAHIFPVSDAVLPELFCAAPPLTTPDARPKDDQARGNGPK